MMVPLVWLMAAAPGASMAEPPPVIRTAPPAPKDKAAGPPEAGYELPPSVATAPPAPVSAADWSRYKSIQEERNRRMNAGDPLGALTLDRSPAFRIAVCAGAADAFTEFAATYPDAQAKASSFARWIEAREKTSEPLAPGEAQEARDLLNVLSMTGMGLSEEQMSSVESDGELMVLYLGKIAQRCRTLLDEPEFQPPAAASQ